LLAALPGALVLEAAPQRWINDGSGSPPRLSVEQAIWAMGGLPRGAAEWSREEKVAKIGEAGFDGFMVFLPGSIDEQDTYADLARRHGLALTLQCAPGTLADLERGLAAVERMKARALVAMIQPTFVSYDEGAAKIRSMMDASIAAGVPFYVETHRGTITQDLLLTQRWALEIAGLQIHADLSHFVISYEIGSKPSGTIRDAFDAILARTGMVDGRIGNGEQVQIDIGPQGASPHAKLFASWWRQAMVNWLKHAGPGDIFVFKPELGPPAYSIVDLEGKEISDRWAQALAMRELGIRTWNEAVAEAGKGQVYRPRARAGAAEGFPPDAPKLEGPVFEIFVLRGDCVRFGDFYLCGQPVQPAYAAMRELGIKSIINVRMPKELGGLGFDVPEAARAAGLEYHALPVSPENFNDARAKLFLETLQKAKKPVLIHDSNGNRPWGLWSLFLGIQYGISVDETKKLAAENDIDNLVIEDFVRAYVAKNRKVR
jgi:uncharacterized protein (TIGR01244 family)